MFSCVFIWITVALIYCLYVSKVAVWVCVCVCVWWLMWGILQPDGAEQGPSISNEKSSGQKAGRAICLGPTPPVDTHMDPGSLTVEPSESTRSRGFGSEHLPACLVAARVNMRFSVLLLETRMVLKFSRPCVVPAEPSRCDLNSRVVVPQLFLNIMT